MDLPESSARMLRRSSANVFISLKLFLFAWSQVARADSGRVAPARAVCRLARGRIARLRVCARHATLCSARRCWTHIAC